MEKYGTTRQPQIKLQYGGENVRSACRISKARMQTHTQKINTYCFIMINAI